MNKKRHALAILLAWIVFIGIDFLFHASIFASLWKEELSIFKSLENLALLIPVGYLSFLLLTILIGYLYFRIFAIQPPIKSTLEFAMIFGILFSLSNFSGLFSFINIPVKHLLVFNLIYFIEIISVTICLHYVAFSFNLKRSVWRTVFFFFILIISGIVIQNF